MGRDDAVLEQAGENEEASDEGAREELEGWAVERVDVGAIVSRPSVDKLSGVSALGVIRTISPTL
jgi:hypothetical protein